MGTPRTEIIPTRQSLLQRLKNWDDSASWKDFFDTYWKLIYGVARKAGLTDSEAQDVVQETIISISRKLPEFQYDPKVGSFKSWLMTMTRWRITDQWRKKNFERQGERLSREVALGTALMERHPDTSSFDLEAAWNEEWTRRILEAALQRVKENANPKQYQLFYLHVIKGMPAKTVAKRLNVKLPEVYFAKYKLAAQIKRVIKTLEQRML